MKGVLTQKELKILLKDKKEKVKEPVPEITEQVKIPTPEKEEESLINYFLFHPDNPKDASRYKNFTHRIDVNGSVIDVPIVNGVAVTDNLLAKNKLIKQGFSFMYEKPKGEDNE